MTLRTDLCLARLPSLALAWPRCFADAGQRRRGHAWRGAEPGDHGLCPVRGVRRRAGRPGARFRPGARSRLPQRHRGPRHRAWQERADRARVWRHDRVRGRHQQHAQHRRELDLLARRLGRGPAGRRGRRRRQQRGRWPDDRGRHGRYRRLGRGDRRGAGGVLGQHQRRDQDPLLHAELRRLQPRRSPTRRPRRTSTAAPTTASSSPTRTAPWPWTARTLSRVPSVYDGEFGGVGVLASVVGLYGELKNDAEDTFGDDKWWGVQTGANVDLFGFKLGGSVGHDEVGETQRDFFTAGIGAGFRPGEHLDHLRPDLQHQLRLRRGHRDRRLGLQPGVLGRLSPWPRAWCWRAT